MEHPRRRGLPTAQEMESRYQGSKQLWSGKPNSTLVDFASTLTPGTALDVGCGEGADLTWLVDNGWQALGIDFSPTAVERTRARGLDAQVADFLTFQHAPFDLVNVQFGGLPATARAVAHLENFVAPGGHLLFVHHDWDSQEMAMPTWLARNLQQLTLVTLTQTPSHVHHGAGAGHDHNLVLIARREQTQRE